MHINAKRMKHRVNKSAEPDAGRVLFYGSPNISADPDIIKDPAELPDYLAITDHEDRAALMGIKITIVQDATRRLYRIEGENLDTQTFTNIVDLKREISQLWEIATEPEIIAYFDNSGRYHERLTFPDRPVY